MRGKVPRRRKSESGTPSRRAAGRLAPVTPGAVLSAAAHAAMIAAAAYGSPWLERRDGGAGAVVAAALVSEAEFAAASKLGRPDADPPFEPDAPQSAASAGAPAETPLLEPEPEEPAPPPDPPKPAMLAAPDPSTTPEAALAEPPRPPLAAPRPAPRPKRSPGPRAAAELPPSPGDAGRAPVSRRGAAQGGGPGSAALMDAMKRAVRAELVQTQGLVERARERVRGGTGDPLLEVTISRDGRLEGARVLRSSGSAVVDAAALRAARVPRRYPAAPEGLPGPRFVFQVWLRVGGG